MKRILVPTDFSDASLPAYKFAVDLAAKTGAEIFVMHAIALPLLQETTFGIQPLPFDAELRNQQEGKAAMAFERLLRAYPAKGILHFHAVEGDVVPGIRSLIEEIHPDLVVIGTHGAHPLDDFFAGSTAGRTARLSSVPVVAVPTAISLESIKNIVLPNALELDQGDLMKHVAELQGIFHAKLHILLINTPLHFHSDEQARQELERFASYYSLSNYTLNCRNHPQESNGIMAFMDEIGADMLVMATHGRKGLARLLKGSIAESLLYTVDRPVWIWKTKK